MMHHDYINYLFNFIYYNELVIYNAYTYLFTPE